MTTITDQLDAVTDVAAHQRDKLEDALTEREELQAQFDAAAVTGQDTSKMWAALEKLDAQIRGGFAAVDAAAAAVASAQAQSAEEARQDAEQRAVETLHAYGNAAIAFEQAVDALAAQWRDVIARREAADAAQAAATRAGSTLETVRNRRSILADTLWRAVFARLLRDIFVAGRTGVTFPSGALSLGAPTLSDLVRRELDAHPLTTEE